MANTQKIASSCTKKGHNLNKTQYRYARRLIRDNGMHALRWLLPASAAVMVRLHAARGDELAERIRVVKLCRELNVQVTAKQLRKPPFKA